MLIDGEKIIPINRYTFSLVGEHTIHCLINLTGKYYYSLNRMFYEIRKLKEIKFTYLFDIKYANNIADMFNGCSSLTSINLSSFNTLSTIDMQNMFFGCSSLTFLNLSNFDTKNVENMENIFNGCNLLTSIIISNFNTILVKNMKI